MSTYPTYLSVSRKEIACGANIENDYTGGNKVESHECVRHCCGYWAYHKTVADLQHDVANPEVHDAVQQISQ